MSVAATFIDVNNDKHLDLIVVSGGSEYPENAPQYIDRLYLNDGSGYFKKVVGGMPQIPSSGSCITSADIDGDGDLDIFVGGRVVPGQYPLMPMSYIAKNEGGKFINVTPQWSEGLFKVGMVTDAKFADIDNDKKPELIVVGEWMPINVFKWNGTKFKDITSALGLDKKIGWWESVHVEDINGDGFAEIIAGNVGLNTQIKASENKPATLHYKDYDNNKSLDPILCYYNGEKSHPFLMRDKILDHMIILKKKFLRYKDYANATMSTLFTAEQRRDEKVLSANTFASKILYNTGGKSFEYKDLPIPAQISLTNSILCIDVNNDGKKDIITAGNYFGTEVLLGRHDASVGNILINNGNNTLKSISAAQSGFNAKGDVRDLLPIKTKEGISILVVRNNDQFSLFKIKSKAK
jgi:enediyne biosynthesis protein E4